MNFKKFVSVNKKRIMGTSLLLSMIFAQTAGAASSVSGSIVSKGNIEYDADSDGKADVYFYSKDLSTLATGIDSLNVDISNMEVAMTQLSNTTTQYKTDIINGLNNSVYAKSNLSSDATFEQIIEKINNIPAPTTATGSYYSGGDNSGLNVGLSSSNTSANVNIDGVTTLDLGIEEAITLPSGYYPNDITIRNNVANRGSVESTTLSAGYYDDQEIELSQVVQNIPVSSAEDFSLGVSYSGRKTLTVANDCLCFASASFVSQDCDTDYRSYYNWGATYYIAYSCIFYGPDGDVLYDVLTDLTYKSKGGSSSKQLYYLPKDSVIEIYYSPAQHGNYNDGGGVSGTFIYLDT